ncbi:MAG: choice-of-anchor Q domain-containing protein, partial [Pyrinomonadaceae bacterium]
MKQRLKTMKNTNKKSLSMSGLCLILLTVLFAFSQARAQGSNLIVNTLADGDDTACNAANCTLREAVKYSPAGSTITFSVTGIIQLVGFTELVINKNLTIAGPGADSLTVKAGVGYIAGIFDIRGGIVNISGLKLSDGKGKEISTYNPSTGVTTRQNLGGAIYIAGGTVTLTSCTLSNNRATNGGAIYVRDGSLAVTGSTISGNDSGAYSYGGGIQVRNGSLAVASSTISGNIAGYGGGLDISGGTATIENSTISGNTAREYWEQRQGLYYSFNGRGGGMYIGAGTVTVTNSTISGNIAEGTNEIQGDGGGRRQIGYEGGGGILNAGVLTVANSTITNNYAVTGAGGGINTYNSTTTMQLSNSILANNTSGGDLTRTASGNYNLVQDASYGTLTGTNNITGQDALLGPLANNGGPTQTHALLFGSPAIDQGNATGTDQRGLTRPSDNQSITNAAGGNGADIGAFEVQNTVVAAGFEGDVSPRPNGDSMVQSNDVVQVRRFQNGTDTPSTSSNELQRADSAPFATKGDGCIRSDDVVQTRRYQNGTTPPELASGPTSPGSCGVTVGIADMEQSAAAEPQNHQR